MQEIIRGVVVKNPLAGSPKICLLTQEYGKIPVMAFKHHQRTRLGLGNFVQSIVLHDQHNSFIVESVELIAQPTLHFTSLGWFHHLLELSYFFCPMHQPAHDVYVVLEISLKFLLVAQAQSTEWQAVQYGLIGYLLTLFGFYPPAQFKTMLNTIKTLLTTTIDFQAIQNLELLKQSAALLQEKDLAKYYAWILVCINTHPRISGFKTLPFVYKTI